MRQVRIAPGCMEAAHRVVGCLLIIAFSTAGCTQLTNPPDPAILGADGPHLYSDQDYAEVLRQYVHDGLVDYEALATNRAGLDRYYALLAVTGPTKTPDQFASSAQVTAYWINAYNALVLVAVLSRYPVESMYALDLPRLEHEYSYLVDGKMRNLAAIEDEILAWSQGDVRALLATSRAAMGTPRLSDQPIRASTLERQLAEAAAGALDDPHLLAVDHGAQSIFVWQVILRRQEDFLAYWRSRRRVETAYTYNVLLELASPEQRRALQSAVGYMLREIAFDRSLNRWPQPRHESAF